MGNIIFSHFVYNWSFEKIWVRIKEWSIWIDNFDFGTRFTNYGVPFCAILNIKKTFGVFSYLSYIGFFFCLADLIKAISVSRPCNWTLMIFLLWFVMVLLWSADLSKRKPEFQVSRNCLRRTLRKDSILSIKGTCYFVFKLHTSLISLSKTRSRKPV